MSRGGSWTAAVAVAIVAAVSSVLVVPPSFAADPRDKAPAEQGKPIKPQNELAAKGEPKRVRSEVTSMTTQTRRVFAEPDGTYSAELNVEPVRVRQSGRWVPVDVNLTIRSDGTVVPKAAAIPISFSGGGAAPLVTFGPATTTMRLTWPGRLPVPTLEKNTATYREVRPGVDLVVRARAQGFAHYLVVRSREAAKGLERIRFGLVTKGMRMEVDKAGNSSAVDAKGRVVIRGSVPEMWDAAGRSGSPAGATPTQTRSYAHLLSPGGRTSQGRVEVTKNHLSILLDKAFLADWRTTYPVVIDPDFGYNPGQLGWAKVFSGKPGMAYWNGGIDGGEAKVGQCYRGTPDRCNDIRIARSYFQYDTSFLAGRYVTYAEFNAYVMHAPNCNAKTIEVHSTSAISPTTTWDSLPLSRWSTSHNFNPCPARSVGWTVTNGVSAGGVTTFEVRAADENDQLAWRKIGWASLFVRYNTPPNAPGGLTSPDAPGCRVEPNEPRVFTPRPRLQAVVSDPEGGAVRANFEWWVRFGAHVGSSGLTAQQASGTGFEHTIPEGAFRDGSKIAWRVQGFDGSHWGPWSLWCDITVDQTAPRLPAVSSPTYPRNGTGGSPGQAGAFTFVATDQDVVGFRYGLRDPSEHYVAADRMGGQAVVLVTPPTESAHDLFVVAVDQAGNSTTLDPRNPSHKYHFIVGAPTGPAGHWPLDGWHTTRTADDASSGLRSGTMTGIYPASGMLWTQGRIRESLFFDGTGRGYVTIASSPIRTDWAFTVSAWVKTPATDQSWRTAASQLGSANSGFHLKYNATGFAFGMDQGDSAAAQTVSATASGATRVGWNHVTGTYDPYTQRIRLYVNGALVDEEDNPYRWHAASGVHLGRTKHRGNFVDAGYGFLDDVRLYQRVLTDDEIATLAGSPTIEEVFYSFDEASPSVHDQTGGLRDAITGGTATREASPLGGEALLLDGNGHAATSGPVVRTDGSYTVSAWVRPDALNRQSRTVVSQAGTRASGFALRYSGVDDAWSFDLARDDGSTGYVTAISQQAAPSADEWVHLVGIVNVARGVVELFVDGNRTGQAQLDDVTLWPANGGLQLGRTKRDGVWAEPFTGAIEDVHVWTGVLTDAQIGDLYQDSPPSSRSSRNTGQFGRYLNHAGEHLTTLKGLVPQGYRFEKPLGLPPPDGAAGTRMLYSCMAGTDVFTSTDPGCEGQRILGASGRVYVDRPAGVPTVPIVRCRIPSNGERFDSGDTACEGQAVESVVGYARGYAYLVRNNRPYSPWDHGSSLGEARPGYDPEDRLGIVGIADQPGTRSLWSCLDGGDEFSSTDPACEGKQVGRQQGLVWVERPPNAQSQLLYRCRMWSTSGEYFDSVVPGCEGRHVDRELGYVISAL